MTKNIRIATWKELHLYKPHPDNRINNWWLEVYFTPRVKNINCKCMEHWEQILKENLVDWNNYFNWTVDMHNLVNKKLDKRIISYKEAREIWINPP